MRQTGSNLNSLKKSNNFQSSCQDLWQKIFINISTPLQKHLSLLNKQENPITYLIADKFLLFSFILIIISYIMRFVFISQPLIMVDEAHYYVWAQHIPYGFYDHGPGIGFFLKFFMLIFGENSFGLRIGGLIFMLSTSWYMYFFCKRHFNTKTAIIALLLFNSSILLQGLSFTATIDTPFFFSLIMAVMCYYDALYYDKKYFYIAGFFLGFSVLSKEAAALVIIPFAFYILLYHRKQFRFKEIYLSILIAFVVFLPFIIFNLQSNFASFHFMTVRIPSSGNLTQTALFWLSQLILISPIFLLLFSVLVPSNFIKNVRKSGKDVYFSFVSFFTFLYFINISINSTLELNWGLAMYVGGFFIVSRYIANNWDNIYIKIVFTASNILSFLFILILIIQYFWAILPLPIAGNITSRYSYYEIIRINFKDYYDKYMDKNIPIFDLSYRLPSVINFYLKPKVESIALNWAKKPNLSYEFFYNSDELLGKDFYYASFSSRHFEKISGYFVSSQHITNLTAYKNGKKTPTLHLYLMKNLQYIETNTDLTNDWLYHKLVSNIYKK